MSEPKLISPMLDHFVMGDPISDHNGVRCCPAMEKHSDNKYIVKIISSPAAQSQLDALLLSGAYGDKESALSYFKALSEDIVGEAQVLQKLSELEGFLPYEKWQIESMGDGLGYDVYLLSTYRRTLQHLFRKSAMTHLKALNLGLDLCAALAVCRKFGYLYVDLKPSNVYLTDDMDFRIGDIGFLKLNSLKYTALPDRYRSQYTAPEISDAFSELNTTMDVYAVGLILYQAFNDGNLPFNEEITQDADLPAPAYADYEMAEIILKACSPDPKSRWQDPIEMGQALVSYMQRNGANDTPIVPVPVQEASFPEISNNEACSEEEDAQEHLPNTDTDETVETDSPCSQETVIANEISEVSIYSEDEEGNLTFLKETIDDETAPSEDLAGIDHIQVSDEVSDMLDQADELIAHETPAPVIQPEPIDVPVPPIVIPEDEPTQQDISAGTDEEADESTQENPDDSEGSDEPDAVEADTSDSEQNEEQADPVTKKTAKHWIRNTLIVLLAVALLAVGFYYYKNYYLQPIEAIVLEEGNIDTLTVFVTSQIDEEKLTVVCSDIYGNKLTSPVINGKATFTGLAPNSAYTVTVVINGFHRLTGDTFAAYTTPQQANIVQFSAVTGSSEDSVILGFTVEGQDATQWKIIYQDDAKENREILFSGRVVTLNGLTVGNQYTFRLEPVDDLYVTGTNVITYTASKIIKADKVFISGFGDGTISAVWTVGEGHTVDNWTVRCYNERGFDKTIVTSELSASFPIDDATTDYTIEVTAAGMSVNERAYAVADSETVENFEAALTQEGQLNLSWDAVKATQEEWLLLYSVDGSIIREVTCDPEKDVSISSIIPGCKYEFLLQTTDGNPILGGYCCYNTEQADAFEGYGVAAEHMEFMMCKTPPYSSWDRYDLSRSDYRTEFSVGEKASYLIRMRKEYDTSTDEITALFVIRDEVGKLVDFSSTTCTWTDMWYRNYCELDIPSIPQIPGNYTIHVYFNGSLANQNPFTVVAE